MMRTDEVRGFVGKRVVVTLSVGRDPFGYLKESDDEPDIFEVTSSTSQVEPDEPVHLFIPEQVVSIRTLELDEEQALKHGCA